LTGGDPISARFMHQDFFEFDPTFKLVIAGNHKPALRGVDEAIKSRMNLVPFTVTIPKEERDKALSEKLQAEWPAILQWMINGCLAWQRQGLNPPVIVRQATNEYLKDEDAIGRWIEECCTIGPNERCAGDDLWKSWKAEREKANEYVGTQTKFGLALINRGYGTEKSHGNKYRVGISLSLSLKPIERDASTLKRNTGGMIDLNDWPLQEAA
jgi:putative DNA primase/helicase